MASLQHPQLLESFVHALAFRVTRPSPPDRIQPSHTQQGVTRKTPGDPNVQEIVTRFYAVRGLVRVDDTEAVREAVRGLLSVVGALLDDQEAVRRLEVHDGAAAAEAAAVALDALGEARGCLHGMAFRVTLRVHAHCMASWPP